MRIPSNAARVIVNTIFDSMRESLEKGEGIEIRDVRPKKLPFFKVGKELKEKVNTIKGKVD